MNNYKFWKLLPFGTLLLAAVMPLFLWFLPVLPEVIPDLSMAVAFFWLAYTPRIMPATALAVGGICFDLFSGNPPGISAILYILMRWVLGMWHRQLVSNDMPPMLLTFAVLSTFLHAIGWLVLCYSKTEWLPVYPVILQLSLGILLYPPLHIALGKLYHSAKMIHEQ